MAEGCPSGKYLAELVTSSGRTLAHPLEDPGSILGVVPKSLLDWSGSETDYSEWHSLLEAIVGRLARSWSMLKTWPKTASMPEAEYNAFVEELNKVHEGYAKLRIPWHGVGSAADHWWGSYNGPDMAYDATDEIAQATQLLIDAQCLRQRIDEKLAEEGGTPIKPGDTAHTPADDGLGIIGTALLVAGAVTIVGGAIAFARKIAKGRSAA